MFSEYAAERNKNLDLNQLGFREFGFALLNPTRNEAVFPLKRGEQEKSFKWHPLNITHIGLNFQVPGGMSGEWFRGARLVVFRVGKSAYISRPVRLEKVETTFDADIFSSLRVKFPAIKPVPVKAVRRNK